MLLSLFHRWLRIGKYRDFAAGYVKMPIDYFVGLGGIVYLPLITAISLYALAFAVYSLLGWYLMNRTHLMNYETEWTLQYNNPLKRIDENVKKQNGD